MWRVIRTMPDLLLIAAYLSETVSHLSQHLVFIWHCKRRLPCLQAVSAAETAIDLCVALAKTSVLWEEVWPRFKAAGQGSVLLERLQPHILADQLRALAPEVMQVRACRTACDCKSLVSFSVQP